MNKFTKQKYIDKIKNMNIDEGDIFESENSNDIEIHIKGKIMKKPSNEISLKSIYDLVINLQENTKENFDLIRKDIAQLKSDVHLIKSDIKELQKNVQELQGLPSIKRELANNQNKYN